MNVGDALQVTFLTYGGAVYGRKGEIINADQRPHKSVKTGRIYFIGPENNHGPEIVKCRDKDDIQFSFYPHKTGELQKVEVVK